MILRFETASVSQTKAGRNINFSLVTQSVETDFAFTLRKSFLTELF